MFDEPKLIFHIQFIIIIMVTRVYGLGPSCVPNVARAKCPKLADGGHERGGPCCNAGHRLPRKGGEQCFYSKEKLD